MLEAALGKGAAVRFEPPTPDWSSTLKRPTVDLFLYDVIEDTDRRSADWEDHRGDDGRVIGRQPPVRYYRLSYLVSAWGKSTEDEHAVALRRDARLSRRRGARRPSSARGSLAEEESRVLVRLCLPTYRSAAPRPRSLVVTRAAGALVARTGDRGAAATGPLHRHRGAGRVRSPST